MLLNRKAQSTLEYAILIAIVVAALLAIQIYMKRGLQGRIKSSSDQIGEQFDAHRTSNTYTTTRIGKTVEVTAAGLSTTHGGYTGDVLGEAEVSQKYGTETVDAWGTTTGGTGGDTGGGTGAGS